MSLPINDIADSLVYLCGVIAKLETEQKLLKNRVQELERQLDRNDWRERNR